MNSAWVINFGATTYMTNDSKLLQAISKSFQTDGTTTDGGAGTIIKEGIVNLTNNLHLDTILIVPSLNYNLLSIS